MPPPVRIRIEATTAPGVADVRQVVHVYLNGYRFEMEVPSGLRARQIAMELARAFFVEIDDG